MPLLSRLGDKLPRRLVLCDVGARGGLQRPWSRLASLLDVVAFEPDPTEARHLAATGQAAKVIPQALWAEQSEVSLHLTRSRGCSSVFEPNWAVLHQFPEADRYIVESGTKVQATTLDLLRRGGVLPTVDFVKLDAQGAELSVLRGGEGLLQQEAVGLEVEVEFAALYAGQPLFGEIDRFAREALGLELWDLRKTYWKYSEGVAIGSPKGQLVFGDALYLRPAGTLPNWCERHDRSAAREKVIMLCVTALAYGYHDYVLHILGGGRMDPWLSPEERGKWTAITLRDAWSLRFWPRGNRYLFHAFNALARLVEPSHGGWATIGRQLGSVRRLGCWT